MAVLARRVLAGVLLGLTCILGAGCASRPLPCADTVEGTLTWGNKPLAGVRVQFVPQVQPGVTAPLSSATTDEKGFFRLSRDDNGKPGAFLGKHKVVLKAGRPGGETRSRDDNAPPPAATIELPKDYLSVTTTPLVVEVKAEQTNYPLQVQ
jgi:hypothetical protein